jgi:hypothetical protein
MPVYEVSYYKYLLSSEGHSFKALQRSVDVSAPDPVAALTSIETHGFSLQDCDCLEVTRVEGGPTMTAWRYGNEPAKDG